MGKEIKCPQCGNEWEYTGNSYNVHCPKCRKNINIYGQTLQQKKEEFEKMEETKENIDYTQKVLIEDRQKIKDELKRVKQQEKETKIRERKLVKEIDELLEVVNKYKEV